MGQWLLCGRRPAEPFQSDLENHRLFDVVHLYIEPVCRTWARLVVRWQLRMSRPRLGASRYCRQEVSDYCVWKRATEDIKPLASSGSVQQRAAKLEIFTVFKVNSLVDFLRGLFLNCGERPMIKVVVRVHMWRFSCFRPRQQKWGRFIFLHFYQNWGDDM